jgi:hypothetical protein
MTETVGRLRLWVARGPVASDAFPLGPRDVRALLEALSVGLQHALAALHSQASEEGEGT